MKREQVHERTSNDGARGFTLIELLVVVAIIALLVSILLPALNGVRDQGKLTKCLAHMRANGEAALTFTAEYGRFQLVSDEVGVALADPDRRLFAYGEGGELLSWPVALAKAAAIDYRNNWDWAVRAVSFTDARDNKDYMKADLGMTVCPSDRVRFATPFYPRNKPLSIDGINNDGLKGGGDPSHPVASRSDMSYWGYLSYGINEDITGAEVAESNHAPACWRTVRSGTSCMECIGERNYPQFSPCGDKTFGRRLQGNLEKIYRPGDVGLIFEAGRDDELQTAGGMANLIISSGARGPYLADFQQAQYLNDHSQRVPTKRHPRGASNVLFADMHGGTVHPDKIDPTNKLPTTYNPNVRVSPYPPAEY